MKDADRRLLPLLAGWLDGELTAEDARRVEAALEHSPELRAVLEEWRDLDRAVPHHPPARPEADWEALALRVENAIDADRSHVATPAHRREDRSASSGWLHRLWAGLGSHRWALGGGGLVAAALVFLLLSPMFSVRMREVGVMQPEPASPERPPATSPSQAGLQSRPTEPKSETTPDALVPRSTASGTDKPREGRRADTQEAPLVGAGMTARDATIPSPTSASAPAPEADARRESTTGQMTSADEGVAQRYTTSPVPRAEQKAAPRLQLQTPERMSSDDQKRATGFQASGRASSPEAWRVQNESSLQEAVATNDRGALEDLVDEIDRHLAETPEAAEDVVVLGMALRARGELLRLFPDAIDAETCGRLQADYDNWLKVADSTVETSSEGMHIRDLVRTVCPPE